MTSNKAACVALGNFDGIHLGHDILIRKMIETGERENLNTVIITFRFIDPNLRKSPVNTSYINNFKTKMEMLKSYDVTNVVNIDLDETISKYTPEQFIKNILIDTYRAAYVVVGYNYRFGHKGMGNTDTLKQYEQKYGYKTLKLEAIKYNGVAVSSSLIRELISQGRMKEANSLLIQNYTIDCNDLSFDYNKNTAFADNRKGLLIPAGGLYYIRMGGEEMKLSICHTNDGAVLTFDKPAEKNENIEFLN